MRMKSNNDGFVTIVVLIAITLIISGGVYYVIASGNDEDGNSVQETVATATQDQINSSNNSAPTSSAYPALYQQYNLPEYPGATITDSGRTSDNLNDGISLELTTSDDLTTIGAFYSSAFSSLAGWSYSPPAHPVPTVYGATATKSDESLRYQLTATKLPDTTKINISFLPQ